MTILVVPNGGPVAESIGPQKLDGVVLLAWLASHVETLALFFDQGAAVISAEVVILPVAGRFILEPVKKTKFGIILYSTFSCPHVFYCMHFGC